MSLIRTAIGCSGDTGRLRKPLRRVADIGDHGVLGLRRPHALVHVGVRQLRRFRPGHLEDLRGLDRVPLLRGDHADEVALAHDARGRDVPDRAFVDRKRLGASAIGALATRQHDAAVQHVGQAHVLHVDVFAGHLVRQIDTRHPRAYQRVAVRRLDRRGARELDVERLVAKEVAVLDRAVRLAVDRNDALRYDQAPGLHAELGRGEREQGLAGFRSSRAHLRTALVNR